jgi:hypothetical protein
MVQIRFRGTNIRVRFLKTVTAAAATGLAMAAAGPLGAQAAASSTVSVPCSATTLATDITGATSGETLLLTAGCTYVLTSALPPISTDLTLQGYSSTLERSLTGSPPDFSLLEVTSGNVTINGLNFRNGDAAVYGGGISNDGGDVTVYASTFSGNTSGEYGGPSTTADLSR